MIWSTYLVSETSLSHFYLFWFGISLLLCGSFLFLLFLLFLYSTRYLYIFVVSCYAFPICPCVFLSFLACVCCRGFSLIPRLDLHFYIQVDLQLWKPALKVIQAILKHVVRVYPSWLLLPPVPRVVHASAPTARTAPHPHPRALYSPNDTDEDDDDEQWILALGPEPVDSSVVVTDVARMLHFLASLLRNSYSKLVASSVLWEVTDLLASGHAVWIQASAAVVCAYCAPCQASHHVGLAACLEPSAPGGGPLLQGMAPPALPVPCQLRCLALARGWGTRAQSLGLAQVVTADAAFVDSSSSMTTTTNEEALGRTLVAAQPWPTEPGHVHYVHSPDCVVHLDAAQLWSTTNSSSSSAAAMEEEEENHDEVPLSSTQKRRRVTAAGGGRHHPHLLSMTEIWNVALEQVPAEDRPIFPTTTGSSRDQDPNPTAPTTTTTTTKKNPDRLFGLVADLQLARSYHECHDHVVAAVELRLQAWTAMLHQVASPTVTSPQQQELVLGYVQAQPECIAELVDLVRPTVADATIHPTTTSSTMTTTTRHATPHPHDALSHLAAHGQAIPWTVRVLALQALTALVARRDHAAHPGTTPVVAELRLSTILTELGIGKGLYMGVLPTLVRYSLAAITTTTTTSTTRNHHTNNSTGNAKEDQTMQGADDDNNNKSDNQTPTHGMDEDEAMAMDLGLAFLEATAPPRPPRSVQVQQALVWLDTLLQLTLVVTSTPTGAAALTESGMVPALLSLIALDTDETVRGLLHLNATASLTPYASIVAQLQFVTAQAVQILETLIVAQMNAVHAFGDLQGVVILTERLSRELPINVNGKRGPSPAQRILIFSLLTCLTVVFHQEHETRETTAAGTTSSTQGSNQLKQPTLANAITHILRHVPAYGGHVTSLISTMLSDVLNHDPHLVHHVHEVGIAQAFFDMMTSSTVSTPSLPPIPELLMSIPNVLAALSLTEAGAKAVKQANPFPALCRIFTHPHYAMPASKCLLNELTAIVGTGLEEIMRHVEGVKPLVLSAIVQAMNHVVELGRALSSQEESGREERNVELETKRSCLIQYVLNMGQLLEQVLHNDDHVEPFCEAGGLTALLDLYRATFPTGWNFLVHVSCLSSLAVSNLHHSTIEDSLTLALKCILLKLNPNDLLEVMAQETRQALTEWDTARQSLMAQRRGNNNNPTDRGVLGVLPDLRLYELTSDDDMHAMARVLQSAARLSWVGGNLALVLKAVGRRMDDLSMGSSSSTTQTTLLTQWRTYITAPAFVGLVQDLTRVQQEALWHVCQARAQQAQREEQRASQSAASVSCRYRLRIVCPEGAVVRNGIEIDSCASVGSMEMGEVVEGTDRCINSSGILRYRTKRGWVSEMTRGHGREPIAEVIHVWKVSDAETKKTTDSNKKKDEPFQRVECEIPTLAQVGVGILARLQRSHGELYTSLSRLVVQGFRTMTTRNPVLDEGTQGAHVMTMLHTMLYKPLTKALQFRPEPSDQDDQDCFRAGTAMYYGCLLDQLLSCLFFEERRERRMVNVLLLAKLVGLKHTSMTIDLMPLTSAPLFECIQYIWDHCLTDFSARAPGTRSEETLATSKESNSRQPLRVGHSVAACFPPVVKFLRRLMSTSLSSSPVATVMSRIKWKYFRELLKLETTDATEKDDTSKEEDKKDDDDEFFQPEGLVKCVQLRISETVRTAWADERSALAPPHLMHPVLSLVGDIIVGLEEEVNKRKTKSSRGTSDGSSSRMFLSDWIRRSRNASADGPADTNQPPPPPPPPRQPFRVSENSIAGMLEMGFSRDHAIDALERTETNRIEVAMEYALTHPPPDPVTAARRRAERQERQQQEQQQQQQQQQEQEQQQQQDQDQQQQEGESEQPQETEASTNNASTTEQEAPGGSDETAVETAVDSSNANAEPSSTANPAEEQSNEATANENGPAPMDVDSTKDQEAKKKESPTDSSDDEDKEITTVLQSWIEVSPTTCCNILAKAKQGSTITTTQMDGDAENEALTVVVTSFLLDLCHRYPDEKDKIVSLLLEELKTKLLAEASDQADDHAISKLTHSVVLFIKALPKVRLMVLKKGLVTPIIARVEAFMDTAVTSNTAPEWPMWLPHSMLLLDIMAQPVVAFSEEDYSLLTSRKTGEDQDSTDICSDYFDVLGDHKGLADSIAMAMFDAFTVLGQGNNLPRSPDDEVDSPKPMPPYVPLLPLRHAEVCLKTCRRLIGCEDVKGKIVSLPPPGILQAGLMLLLHLLRTPSASTECIKEGVVEAILSLGGQSRFTGNSGLITLIFRRLLEDESTLLAAMETEIRTTMAKLVKNKSNDAASSSKSIGRETVSLRSFVEAATPLICRDASVFLKAMSSTIRIEGDFQASEPRIGLIPPEERIKKPPTTSTTSPEPPAQSTTMESTPKQPSKPVRRSLLSGGSSRRRSSSLKSSGKGQNSSSRRGKREKAELQREDSVSTLSTPATLITYHLVGQILSVIDQPNSYEGQDGQTGTFLEQWELLGILSDLILAVPACASSVHNYRPHRHRDKRTSIILTHLVHAVPGAPSPTKSFVNFLLHVVLAEDRWSLRNEEKIWVRAKRDGPDEPSLVVKKKVAARVLKTSQAAGRVLLALCARPGEGRRRVIADLAFALSGGHLGQDAMKQSKHEIPSMTSRTPGKEQHALYAWGELCLGLAVPRGGGKNLEMGISINYEIVRIMFESGMVHALMYAVHLIPFDDEMASSTLGTVLLPLEILTRPNVCNFVAEMVQKEAEGQATLKGTDPDDVNKSVTGTAEHLETGQSRIDGIDTSAVSGPSDLFQAPVADDTNVDDAFYMGVDSEDTHSADDDAVMELEEEDDDNESEDDDESIDEDGDEEEDMSEDEQSENELDENDEEEEEESDDVTSEEVDDEGDWNLDYEFAFGSENAQPNDGEEAGNDDPAQDGRIPQPAIDEGWTRIESTGFGGMLLSGVTNRAAPGGDMETDRARGFVDAAEAMIGTLLRNGEINQESIAELEGQLGLRIMAPGGRRIRVGTVGGNGGDPLGETSIATRILTGRSTTQQGRNNDVVGTLPHVHQRSQPDAGYSAFGGSASGRLADLSSIEIVFGGPSVTAGSRNYNANRSEQDENEENELPYISQMDLQLFPGGPASATIARAQHSLHPLLCGVDLPPINALVMDLFPHGIRARRTGQLHTRRPGDWTNTSFSHGGYLVSTATGNIIRSNRSHSGASLGSGLPSRSISGPIGWTDDGLPFDSTVEQLGTALHAELTRSLREHFSSNNNDDDDEEEDDEDAPAQDGAQTEEGGTENNGEGGDNGMAVENVEQGETAPREDDSPSMGSEGEHVASSLAASLRLSSTNDEAPVEEAASSTTGNDNAAVANETEEPLASGEQIEEAAMEETEEDPGAEANEPGESDETTEQDNGDESNEQEEVLVCPPNIEPDVFHSLPREMQRDVVNEYASSRDLAAQLDGTSLDPEVLAALPEDMRQEVIEQERRERMRDVQEAAPADPSRAEEMDNASFIASLSPELRAEILVTADEETLSSLPPNLVAEANVLRERAAQERQRVVDGNGRGVAADPRHRGMPRAAVPGPTDGSQAIATRKKPRTGKLKVEVEREQIIYTPDNLSAPFAMCDLMVMLRLFFLLSPIRPYRLPQKILQNLCGKADLRMVISSALLKLLHEEGGSACATVEAYADIYSKDTASWRVEMDRLFRSGGRFPPETLLGVAPEISQIDDLDNYAAPMTKFKQGTGAAASVASNMPKSTAGSKDSAELPPVVAARLIDTLHHLAKASPRFCAHSLSSTVALVENETKEQATTFLESMMDLIQRPRYLRSSTSLDQLLSLLETVVSPLSQLPRGGEEEDSVSKKELDSAAATGKEWVDVPSLVVSPSRLQAFCSILRIESCRETAFMKVNIVLRRLCRVDSNRRHVLAELASVAHSLGEDAVQDLKSLKIRMEEATQAVGTPATASQSKIPSGTSGEAKPMDATGKISSSVTFSTSTSELKLLRVLQTLQSMCSDTPEEVQGKKGEGIYVTEELVHLLRQLEFGVLWDELSSCLKIVQVLEGVATLAEGTDKNADDADGQDEGSAEGDANGNKKLRNSSAGILTRFLPSIEAFFVATASATKPKETNSNDKTKLAGGHREIPLENIVGASRLIDFVGENRVLLNALIRNNPSLLDRGLRALVHVPRCRVVLDFDVKRQWFKTQVRRLRQQASRRYGNIRLHINRRTVFEEAYHQLRLRNADEMRGRLHITFRDEEGIDAGGLSREFFAILAKEMFNPNYALFTSTEDGCTFQPNPNSSINPDHLSYFRFCGRIVGKAVADGYLLDAHFTRSLYKHMLGMKPSHQDMEAIDPDYYRNLKTILDYNLEDIGLELFFSIDDNSFGRRKVIDLIENGRKVPVTEANKEEYVQLVCEHRMTTAIQNQIKAYLDGFYELVSPDLIAIFTPRELELVISGLPDIDVDDLKKNTEYVGWKATDEEIQWFWNVLTSLSRNQKAAFLQFVTGSSKVPLAGFGELQGMRGVQKFSLHKVTNQAKGSLMSAHTCFNSLDLPVYGTEDELKEKLLYAIHEGAGSFLFA